MATGQLGAVFRQFNRLFSSGSVSGLSEGQLLARFVEKRDEAAFEALVSRFGPMVLGVCRQMLADPHAVDDAFQATFLVLVRRARSIRDGDLLGNWLYGVALKVARRSRSDLAKRRTREKEGQPVTAEPIGETPAFDDLDLGPVLHEELAKLPEKYRTPMVLCFLDGQTCEEAARRLGWPVGTVKGRISRAKDLLRERLSRRGVTASVAIVAATLTKTADAAVSPMLLNQTVKAAMVLAAGGAIGTAGLGSAAAVALADGVNTTMMLTRVKMLAVAVGMLATVAGGAGVMARQGVPPEGQDRKEAIPGVSIKGVRHSDVKSTVNPPVAGADPAEPDDVDRVIAAFPLPANADADLAATRVKLAKQTLGRKLGIFEKGTNNVNDVLQAARNYLDARIAAAGGDRTTKTKAIEDQVRLMGGLLEREKGRYDNAKGEMLTGSIDAIEAEYSEASLMLATAKNGGEVPDKKPQHGGGISAQDTGKSATAKTDTNGVSAVESDDPSGDKKILAELEKPIAMPFQNETPLEELIKYVQTATTGPGLERGLPIYIEHGGLEEAEKTTASPIKINVDGIKLKTTLRLTLKQLGLGYYVKHGLLIITNLDDIDYKDATNPAWRARVNMGGGMGGMGGGMGGMGGGRGMGGAMQGQPAAGGGGGGGGAAPAGTPKGGGGLQ